MKKDLIGQMQMLTIPFRYKGQEYYTLVRVKPLMGIVKLEVTIMNGELERRLYGCHVFRLCPNGIDCEAENIHDEVRDLHEHVQMRWTTISKTTRTVLPETAEKRKAFRTDG